MRVPGGVAVGGPGALRCSARLRAERLLLLGKFLGSGLRGPAGRRKHKTDRDLARLEEEVSQRLGTTVQIRPGRKGSGTIVVSYSGLDHLDQLLKKLR